MYHKLGMVSHTWNPLTWEVEVERLGVLGQSRLQSEFKTSLDYMKPSLKKCILGIIPYCYRNILHSYTLHPFKLHKQFPIVDIYHN